MVPEVVGLLSRATGVETTRKLYEQTYNPDNPDFKLTSKFPKTRALCSALATFMMPAGMRVITAESDIRLFENYGNNIKYYTWLAGWAADLYNTTAVFFMSIELARTLDYPNHLAFILAGKFALNAATHLSLNGARCFLDKIKGAPIQIRV